MPSLPRPLTWLLLVSLLLGCVLVARTPVSAHGPLAGTPAPASACLPSLHAGWSGPYPATISLPGLFWPLVLSRRTGHVFVAVKRCPAGSGIVILMFNARSGTLLHVTDIHTRSGYTGAVVDDGAGCLLVLTYAPMTYFLSTASGQVLRTAKVGGYYVPVDPSLHRSYYESSGTIFAVDDSTGRRVMGFAIPYEPAISWDTAGTEADFDTGAHRIYATTRHILRAYDDASGTRQWSLSVPGCGSPIAWVHSSHTLLLEYINTNSGPGANMVPGTICVVDLQARRLIARRSVPWGAPYYPLATDEADRAVLVIQGERAGIAVPADFPLRMLDGATGREIRTLPFLGRDAVSTLGGRLLYVLTNGFVYPSKPYRSIVRVVDTRTWKVTALGSRQDGDWFALFVGDKRVWVTGNDTITIFCTLGGC